MRPATSAAAATVAAVLVAFLPQTHAAMDVSKVVVSASSTESVIEYHSSSRFQIQIPKSLFVDEGYEHREALFGVPPYGGSIAQKVYYTEDKLCDADVDTRGGYPARPNEEDGEMGVWEPPFILMVDRGECTFVHKVRNAQKVGAAGVLISDTTCLCSFKDKCKPENEDDLCEQFEPVMADDGSGADISIPAFLLFKQDADLIKEELKANHVVQAEMAWHIPRPDNRVEYDFWTVPTEHISKNFQTSFQSAALELGKNAFFTPHFFIYDGIANNCHGTDGSQCFTLCTNSGRYCALDPDNRLDKGISGQDVVKESLRRICIWKHYGSDGIGEIWWAYVSEFMERCDSADYFSDESCIADAYKHSNVDGARIAQCISDSGGLDNDNENHMLSNEIRAKNELGVIVVPSVFVNNVAMRGQLSLRAVFNAICMGYLDGTEPKICGKCGHCGDPSLCIKRGKCYEGKVGGVSTSTFLGTLVLSSTAICLIGLFYYRKSQVAMRNEVRGILAEYMPLDEDGEVGDSSEGGFGFAKRPGVQQGMQIE